MLACIFPQYCFLCKQKIAAKQLLCRICEEGLPIYQEDINTAGIKYHALFYYQDEICHMLKQFKFKTNLSLTLLFGNYLTHKIKQQPHPDLIIPVPLHKKRLQERGFNQCIEIAKVVSTQLQIPIDKHSLIRHKHTKPQVQCGAAERKHNIKNAFKIKKPIIANRVILLDDVITTGGTIRACHKALLTQDIKQIDIWCIAKAV